jgi:hypothetical protein
MWEAKKQTYDSVGRVIIVKLINADVGDAELRRLYDVWNLAMAPAEGREIAAVDKNMRLLKLMRSFLKSMPTVDAVQVVHCGEYKFRCCNNKCILDDPPRRDFDDDDFCSQGEREDDKNA